MDDLSNDFLNELDEYLRTVVGDYKLVTNWKGETAHPAIKPDTRVTFTQPASEVEGNEEQQATTNAIKGVLKRKDRNLIQCQIYGDNHYASDSPKKILGSEAQAPEV